MRDLDWGSALLAYQRNRQNGDRKGAIPGDGKYTRTKGRVEGDYVYGVYESDGEYHYEVRYDEGPKDKEWMEEDDWDYIQKLMREGKLLEKEPNADREIVANHKYRAEITRALEAARAGCRSIEELDHKEREKAAAREQAEHDRGLLASISERLERHIAENAARDAKEAKEKAEQEVRLMRRVGEDLGTLQQRLLAQMPWLKFGPAAGAAASGGAPLPLRSISTEITSAMRETYHVPLPDGEGKVFPSKAVLPEVKVPPIVLCPITRCIMVDPVTTCDQQTYEREAIEHWLSTHDTGPLTNEKLANKTLSGNLFARQMIDGFLAANPQLRSTDEVYLPKAKLLALRTAIEQQNLSEVRKLVNEDRRLLAAYLAPMRTTFHTICELGNPALLAYILSELQPSQLEAILHLPKPDNWQPQVLNQGLLDTAKRGEVSDMEHYLRLGANIEARDREWRTPLCWAAISGNVTAVDFLLSQRASHRVRDNGNNAPLDLAVLNGHGEVVNLLLDRVGLPPYEPTSPSDVKYFSYMTLKLTRAQLRALSPPAASADASSLSEALARQGHFAARPTIQIAAEELKPLKAEEAAPAVALPSGPVHLDNFASVVPK